jgi:hypothetical protein
VVVIAADRCAHPLDFRQHAAVLFHWQIVVSPFVWGSKQAATYHPQVASHWSRYEESAERLDEPCIRTMRYGPNLPNKRGCWALTIEANRNIKYGRDARPYLMRLMEKVGISDSKLCQEITELVRDTESAEHPSGG